MIRLLVVCATVSIVGCVTSRGAAQQCGGTITATVRNNWSQPVDVYARMRGSSGFILGEVAPGERREFDLPDGATGVYYDWRRATIFQPTSSDIATSYDCR